MPQSRRIAHLTSVHPRHDVRIFEKECASLAAQGFDVHLLVADGRGTEVRNGVSIHDIGAVTGRLQRIMVQPWRMWRAARRLAADLYHFHDPELLPAGLLLRIAGAKVVYDSHEDVPRALLSKHWISRRFRSIMSMAFELFENFSARRLSAVVAATPHIGLRFTRLNPLTTVVNNYPLRSELDSPSAARADERTVCYVGGISRIRGAVEMISALEFVDAKLVLAGAFDTSDTESAVRALPGWSRVDYRGTVSRDEVRKIMGESCAGLLFFHPEPNHVHAQPNKMFEYMAAGLPVLASDFPLWRSILVETGAGECAAALDPKALATVIRSLLDDRKRAQEMGARGREAVMNRFLWEHEARKLCDLYSRLLG